MKAVILAAGVGTRLKPITLETPKPLIEIGGKAIIDRIFASLPSEVSEVVIVVDHLKDKIKSYVGEEFRGRKVFYIDQGEKKGTFGALLSTRHLFEGDERFLVLNGDDIHDHEELEDCIKYPRSLGVQRMLMPRYHNIILDNDGFVVGFKRQNDDENKEILVATGAYVLDSNIFNHPGVMVGGNEYGLPQSVFAQLNKYPLKAVETNKWIPINSIADIELADRNLSKL